MSLPPLSASGQAVPNGPRNPSASPGFSRVSARDTSPTARTVWISGPGMPGSPLTLTGISPMPKA